MRLLLYTINHSPELIGVGKYTGEMTAWLARHDVEVRVVCAQPYYPEWRVWPGFSAWQYTHESRDGGRVTRCPVWVPARPTGSKRLLHLLSFALSSAPVLLWQAWRWQPDIVMMIAPTMMGAPASFLAARLGGARSWLHVQDFELDAATGLGLLGRLERWLMRGFALTSSITPAMMARLREKTQGAEPAFFPNWVDTQAVYPMHRPVPMRQTLGLPADAIVALYSGNMGEKQGLDLLVAAAQSVRAHPRLTFVLAGDGAARPRLQAAAAGLPNLRFLPLQPAERLNEWLNVADIHLLPQRPGAADLVMPSKLTGMLASGLPVLATAAPGTQLAEVAAHGGVVVPPDDVAAFSNALLALADDPVRRAALGAAGRQYAVQHLDREPVLHDFLALAHRLVAGQQGTKA